MILMQNDACFVGFYVKMLNIVAPKRDFCQFLCRRVYVVVVLWALQPVYR